MDGIPARLRRRSAFAPALAAALGLALAAPPLMAANRGVPLASGDRATGEIDLPGDQDAFLVGLPEGGSVSAKVKAAQGTSLLPHLAVLRPDGSGVDVSGLLKGSGKASLSLKPVAASSAGDWAVVVSGLTGTTGPYEISLKVKGPKGKIKGTLVPANGTVDFPVSGTEDGILSVQVKEVGGAPLAGLQVVDPSGAVLPLPEGTFVRKKTTLKGSNIVLTGGAGLYAVRALGSTTGATTVDAKIKVKIGKTARRVLTLGPEPRIASFDPLTGPDGTTVTLTGTGFAEGATVTFGTFEAASVNVVSDTEITCAAPASPTSDTGGTAVLTVFNPDGQSGDATGSFTFIGVPAVNGVSPSIQPLAGGGLITVTGARFRDGFTLKLGNVAIPGSLGSSSTITFTAPARTEGPYSVAVTDEFGRTATMLTGLQYTAAPTITTASPRSASFTGGRTVTLTGTRFRTGARVFVDGEEATPVTVTGTTSLRFPLPAGEAGTFDVEVRDEFGQSTTSEELLSRRGPFVALPEAVPEAPAGTDFFGTQAALGDLDGDGRPDLVLATDYPGYDKEAYVYLPGSRILMNDGSGAFSDGTDDRHAEFTLPGDYGQAGAVAVGDLDGDQRAEVLLSLTAPLAFPEYWFDVGGNLYAYYIKNPSGGYYADYLTFTATRALANDGDGYFTNATSTVVPNPASTPVFGLGERWQASASALGDLDKDGDLDLVLAASPVVAGTIKGSYTGSTGTYLEQAWTYTAGTRVLRNSGGTLTAVTGAMPALTYTTGYYGSVPREDWGGEALALGDLDGDGDLDMIVARSFPGSYYKLVGGYYYRYFDVASRLLRNGGTGTFTNVPSSMPPAYAKAHPNSYDYGQADSLALGDLDGDGDLDLVLGRRQAYYFYETSSSTYRLDTAIRVFRNAGGTMTEATSFFLPDDSWRTGSSRTILSAASVALGDLDGDSFPDLVVTGSVYSVYDAGSGYGYFGVVPAGYREATRVLVNDGTGKMKDVTADWMPSPSNGDFHQAQRAMLGDLDGDGDLDLVLSSGYYPYVYGISEGYNRPLRVFENQ